MVNGKAKGASAERELAELLTYWGSQAGLTLTLKRNLEQTRAGGHDLVGLEPYGLAVECKRVEVLDVRSWWAQAVRQANAVSCLPVLAYKQNRKEWRFKVRVTVAVEANGRWDTVAADVEMEMLTFKAWFITHLRLFSSGLSPTVEV